MCNFQNRLVKFKDFSGIFKDLVCFQALSEALNFKTEFKHFQGLLKHTMNPKLQIHRIARWSYFQQHFVQIKCYIQNSCSLPS